MVPAAYAVPVAAILALTGAVACFAGHRLFRAVLGIYGFILGAFVTSSVMGTASTWALVLAGFVGGLIGAGLASLGLHVAWRIIGGDPPVVLLVIVAVLGALGALSVSRHVVIIGTALAGSWTLMVGALALAGDRVGLLTVTPENVWVVYASGPWPSSWMVTGTWIVLSICGAVVQTTTTGTTGKVKKKKSS
jgi:hypothetical protein